MITVTASPINTFTPVVDGAVAVTTPAMAGAVSPEGFSTALNTQMGLLVQPTTNVAMLTTPTSAMLAAITTTPTTLATAPTPELSAEAALIMTTPTLSQTVSTTNTSSINPATIDGAAVATMSAEDSAILSTVTDTLKFITSGTKLGDTLPAGQSVQLPMANSATALTQQSMQTAVQQAVTNTAVNTPASILVQQQAPILPAPVQTAIAQLQTTLTQETAALPVLVQTALAQLQTALTQQTTALPVPVQTALTQLQTTLAQQVSDLPAPMQAALTQQTTALPVPVQTALAQLQTALMQETAALPVPVQTALAQLQTALTQETSALPVSVQTAFAQLQTALTQQTTVLPVSVQTALVQLQSALAVQEPAILPVPVQNALAQLKTALAEQTPEPQASSGDSVLTEFIAVPLSQNEAVLSQQNNISKKPTSEATAVEQTILLDNGATPLAQVQNISVKENPNTAISTTSEQKTKSIDNQDAAIIQVMPSAIIVPQIAAQVTSVQSETVSADISSNTTAQDKLSLTSASVLLKEAVTNRNTGGDAANNSSSNGGNTPSNPTLPSDASLNQTVDNKQSAADLKPFASLLTAEKSDVIGASATASTGDKSAPQAITAAVNKLVQDTKVDVPAMTKPLSHPEWHQDMGERIVWMNTRGISSAEIKMNPQNMGPITVRIDMNQDQATIAFTAQNSDVRTALEASIPKLREMLNSQQVTLADVSVSQQSSSNDSGRSQQQTAQMMADASANGQGNRQTNQEVDAQGNPVNANNADGTVDEFAEGQVIDSNGTNGLLSIYA